MADLHPQTAQMIALIRAEDLAANWGYAGVTNAFRALCAKLDIKPLPERPGWYDPHHVRQRMNAAQGISSTLGATGEATSLVEQRRARNGKTRPAERRSLRAA